MAQINAVENPIITSPYEEPRAHWHIATGKQPEERDGRRLASYFLRVPEKAARGGGKKRQPDLYEEDTKAKSTCLTLPTCCASGSGSGASAITPAPPASRAS
jgi:type III restriction enzyme